MATKSLTKNSIFYLIYNVLNVLFPFVTGIYVARVLLPDAIGEVAYAQNVVQYFVIFAFLGIPTYGMREIAKARNNKAELNKVYSELFVINLISTAAFSVIYFSLIFIVPRFHENLILYLIVGITLLLNALNNSWLYEGVEEFSFISVRNLIFKVVAFAFLIIFVRGEGDYLYYAAVTVVGTAGNYILNIAHAHKFVKFSFKDLELKRHLKPIFLLVVVNLAIEIYTLIDVTMLGIFYPQDPQIVAYYTYGSKIEKILKQIITSFTMVLVPRISLYHKEGRMTEFNDLLGKVLKIIFILACPMIVGLQFTSVFLLTKIYGEAYLSAAHVLQILSFILLISPIGYLLGSRVLLVAGKESKMIIAVGAGAILNIVGNAVLIGPYKEYGAAIASVVSEVAVMAIYIFLARKYFNLTGIWDTIIKVLIASGLIALYLFGCSYIPIGGWYVLAIQVVGAIGIYFAFLLLTREKIVVNNMNKVLKKFARKKN